MPTPDRVPDRERSVPCVRDPHHDGADEWALIDGHFYSRIAGSRLPWQRCRRVSATPARIQLLASLCGAPARDDVTCPVL